MIGEALTTAAKIGLALAAVLVVVSQCRKPWSVPGRLFARLMNRSHAGVTTWGLSHVTIGQDASVLDVGCGGGRTVHTLAAIARSVKGIDYSAASVAVARKTNADLIDAGRVDVRQASVAQLPFADASFDLATAIETHYYWPDPVHDFGEILRVLKPGATLLVVAETYRNQRFGVLLLLPMLMLRARYLTLDQHRELLRDAGFTDIVIDHEPRKGWICAVARRPEALAA